MIVLEAKVDTPPQQNVNIPQECQTLPGVLKVCIVFDHLYMIPLAGRMCTPSNNDMSQAASTQQTKMVVSELLMISSMRASPQHLWATTDLLLPQSSLRYWPETLLVPVRD